MNTKYYIQWALSTWFGVLHQKQFCPLWDAKLNELLDKYSDTAELSRYTVLLGKAEVWIGNRFYSYGGLYHESEARPAVRTMVRLAALQDRLHASVRGDERDKYKRLIDSIS